MKRLLTFAMLLALSYPMLAEKVDYQKATTVATTVLPNKTLTVLPLEPFENLLVFNAENGFVMVAADDCVKPILAYSTDFPFHTEDMPENVLSWLQMLNDGIQYAIDMKLEATDEIRREWDLLSRGMMPEPKSRTEVKPLVKTHWNQSAPYNNLCPDGSVTGCVATAMAQIMKYWEWPMKGEGSHSYEHETYGMISLDFSHTYYDWDNMVDRVSTTSPESQQSAVATLMYHCGVSVDMNYSPTGSSAYSDMVITALGSYFDYDASGIQGLWAFNYDEESWKSIIKKEIGDGCPVYYSGRGDSGGHAFVCDGYDANDYLHINWGWGGYCDGYYVYGALNPGTGGIGSGNGSYNELNFIITGIHPNTPSVSAPDNLSASVSDREVTLYWDPVPEANHYKVYRNGSLVDGDVTDASFTESDVTYGDHVYSVKAVNSDGVYSLKSSLSVSVTYSGPVPTNLTANVQASGACLNWTAPASENAQLKYGDGMAAPTAYGSNSGLGFCWGQRFTREQLSSYAGMAVSSVEIFLKHEGAYTLYIFREDDQLEPLVTRYFYNENTSPGWFTVNLETPLPIDYFHNMIVAFYNDNTLYQGIAAYKENYDGDDNARLWLDLGMGSCYVINNNISWLIRTNVTDGTYTYCVYRDGQAVADNVTGTSYVDMDLSEGYYQYAVRTHYYGGLSDPSETIPVLIGAVGLVSVSANLPEAGDVAGGGFYVLGATVTVSAFANLGYLFDRWTENGAVVSTSPNYSFVADGEDHALVAEFKENDLEIHLSVTDPTCHGGGDGSVAVDVVGGAMPFVFEFDGQTYPVSETSYAFHDVRAGSYSLKVTDSTGFVVTADVELSDPKALTAGKIILGSETLNIGESASTIVSLQDAISGQPGVTYRWKQNGTVIDDSNSAEYTPMNLAPGSYIFTREVMDDCTDWTPSRGTWTVLVRQTDVEEDAASRLKIYPNPTSDKVTVCHENMKFISVISVTGQQIVAMEVNDDQVEVDLTGVPSGMYLLMICSNDGARCFIRISKR